MGRFLALLTIVALTTLREGEVMEELQRGYLIGDRLLRPSMVKVAKQS